MNKHIKALTVGLTVFGLSNYSISQEEKQLEQQAQVIHTLTSTPDQKTELNSDLAAKVRKLAIYVLQDENKVYSDVDDLVQESQVVVKIRNLPYSVYVIDINEETELAKVWKDNLTIAFGVPDGNTAQLVDEGLDGLVNSGRFYEDYRNLDKGYKILNVEENIGLENQSFFQQKYEETLNVLLEHYERKNSK